MGHRAAEVLRVPADAVASCAASTLIVAPQHVTGVARFFPVQHGGLSWISSN